MRAIGERVRSELVAEQDLGRVLCERLETAECATSFSALSIALNLQLLELWLLLFLVVVVCCLCSVIRVPQWSL